jgi:hypothetical protein
LAEWALLRLQTHLRRVVIGGFLILFVLGYAALNFPAYRTQVTTQKQDWRAVAGFLAGHVSGEDVIVPGMDLTWICLKHYLPEKLQLHLAPNRSGTPQNLPPLARSGKRLWYVTADYSLKRMPSLEQFLDDYFTRVFVADGSESKVPVYRGPN